MLGCGNEIGEGIHLAAHATGVVPGFTHFAAAANMRDGENQSAIEETEAIRTEGDGNRNAVAAVAVQQERGLSLSVERRIAARDERDRYLGSVRRGGVNSFAGVKGRVVPAQDCLLFEQGAGASDDVEVVYGAWSDERFVEKTDLMAVKFRVGAERCAEGRFVEGNAIGGVEWMRSGGCEIDNSQGGEAVFAFDEDKMGFEGVRAADHNFGAIGNKFTPIFATRVGGGGGNQVEGSSARIGTNVESAAVG